MNPQNLSANEVLRMCEPQTDLEKRLFDLVAELDSEIHYLQGIPVPDCDCDECDDFEDELDEIRQAVSLIESGKVDGGLKKLKAMI